MSIKRRRKQRFRVEILNECGGLGTEVFQGGEKKKKNETRSEAAMPHDPVLNQQVRDIEDMTNTTHDSKDLEC